ncbi:MAG: CGGC domain-containing protein [Syntrophomonadaceae bacterium]|nr:CGGC domain-containing protein [Syntrophomonadaceae bacterium]
MDRVGVICCGKRWTKGCPGIGSHVLCFEAIYQKRGPLGTMPEAEIVSFHPCRNCSATSLADTATSIRVEDKAQVIVLASCLFMSQRCPHVEEAVQKISAQGSKVILGSFWDPASPPAPTPTPVGGGHPASAAETPSPTAG